MEKLNVICDVCKKGNLVCLDLIQDDYKVGCTDCDHVFWTHYTGYDNILEAHEYNSMICEDVKVLNSNGVWVGGSERFKEQDFSFEDFAKGMKHLQTIDVYETIHYYRDGANFIQLAHNKIHKTIYIYRYEAKPENLPALMRHFFSIA